MSKACTLRYQPSNKKQFGAFVSVSVHNVITSYYSVNTVVINNVISCQHHDDDDDWPNELSP